MNLDKYELSQWEKDTLNEFNEDDCLEDLLDFMFEPNHNKFLIRLADDLFTFKNKVMKCQDK